MTAKPHTLQSVFAAPGTLLSAESIHDLIDRGLTGIPMRSRVLVLIPDHTRSLPLPQLFRMLVEVLA